MRLLNILFLNLLWQSHVITCTPESTHEQTFISECLAKSGPSIGIDLGKEMVTTAIAYSTTNITTISQLVNPEIQTFADSILYRHLDLFLKKRGKTRKLQKSLREKSSFEKVWATLKDSLPNYLKVHPWFKIASAAISRDDRDTKPSLQDVSSPEALAAGFSDLLKVLRLEAREKHGIDVAQATLAVPTWFGYDEKMIYHNAARKQGLQTGYLAQWLTREKAAAIGAGVKENDRVLALIFDTWFFEMSSLSTGKELARRISGAGTVVERGGLEGGLFQEQSWEASEFGRQFLHAEFARKVVMRSGINVDKAEMAQILHEIEKTRLVGYVGDLASFQTGEQKQRKITEKMTEWPINVQLKDGRLFEGILLKSDTIEVEDAFVQALSLQIDSFLESLTLLNTNEFVCGQLIPENRAKSPLQEIDAVVIISQNIDGPLLERAVRKVLGGRVPVYGASTWEDWPLAAHGAALLDFERKRETCVREKFIRGAKEAGWEKGERRKKASHVNRPAEEL